MLHRWVSIRNRGDAYFRSHFPLLLSTKTPILCSRSPKMRVQKGKKAQKPRFCARNTRKRGFQTPKKHKNPDFVLEMPENGGSEGQKRTKTPILCSESPKTAVSKVKSAQKPRFCARKARKWRFRRPKKHKNPDFVLEKPENGGSGPLKRTKTPILCSGRRGLAPGRGKISIGKHNNGVPANHRAHLKNANTSQPDN